MFAFPTAVRNALAHTATPSSATLLATTSTLTTTVNPRANRSPMPNSPILNGAPRMQSTAILPVPFFGNANTPDFDQYYYPDFANRIEASSQQASSSSVLINEANQGDDIHRMPNYMQSGIAARGSITTHTPLTYSAYNHAPTPNVQSRGLTSDAAVERLGLGFSGLTLDQHNGCSLRSFGHANGLFGTRAAEATARSVTFAVDMDEIEDDDGWEADTEMHSDNEDMCDDNDTTSRLCAGQRRFRNRSSRSRCRNRPLTPYYAPNGEDSWLGGGMY